MKNLKMLTTEAEVLAFTSSLWQSDLFRRSASKEGGYIQRWARRFAECPRLIAEASEPDIEASHFYSWMNALTLRAYDNPVVSDLYYLHEMVHMATLYGETVVEQPTRAKSSFESWRSKMMNNELEASLTSEVLVYFALPELRTLSFPFEIWADRFLSEKVRLTDKEDNAHYYQRDRLDFTFALTRERLALRAKAAAGRDAIENMVAQYARQNEIWAEIWREHFQGIETAMERFSWLSRDDRHAASSYLLAWTKERLAEGAGVPFREEAETFAAIYHAKKKADQKVYDSNPRPELAAKKIADSTANQALTR